MTEMLEDLFPDGLAGIVFDCDGVMIDSEEANRFFYNAVLHALGLPPMTKEQEKFAFMATARESLLRMTPEFMHERLDQAAAEAINYERDVLPRVKLMPGFLGFIEKAHSLGLRMAIDTNRVGAGIQRVLDFFCLPHYFDPVISASLAEPKPSPQGVLLVCAAWNARPGQILFVGDSENDRKTAKAAGAVFAAFGGKGLAGDIEAENFASFGKVIWPFAYKNK